MAERNVGPALKGEQALRPRARLLRTFGDELISSETVALIELVKNSYDADATRVVVRFRDDAALGQLIEVIDNGHGMSIETVRDTWLEPATLFRARNSTSERLGRRVLGQKGIGRFATSRLADELELITRRSGDPTESHAHFDWSQFDDDSLYLDEVRIRVWQDSPDAFVPSGEAVASLRVEDDHQAHEWTSKPHGVLLRMTRLRSEWTKKMFEDLRIGLARLISPFIADELQDAFQIKLDLPEPFEELDGLVEPPELFHNPHYSLEGKVDARGRYTLNIKVRGEAKPVRVSGQYSPKGRAPQSGPFQLNIQVWDRDTESLGPVASEFGSSVKNVRGDLDRIAGINIYRDGFRVLPYGEPRNDWLRLDIRRVQNPTLRLSNNQIVGYIFISADDNPHLRDQSNREGLIENPAFRDLYQIVLEVLKELEQRRWSARHPKGKKRPGRGGLFSGFDLNNVRRAVQRRHPEDAELLDLVANTQEEIGRRVEELQTVLSRYRRLATLGQLIDTVLHDARAPIGKINNEAELGLREAKHQSASGFADSMLERLSLIDTQVDVVATVFKKIEPFGGRRRGRPKRQVLEEVIAAAFDVLSSEINEVGVEVKLPQSQTEVTVDPAELQEVIINLLQNSLHWLREVSKGKRKIVVRVRRLDDGLSILFSDSGPGVKSGFEDQIFEPYFSTKTNGVGLGLAIAGEIVSEYYGGQLELLQPGPEGGARFRIVLRRRV